MQHLLSDRQQNILGLVVRAYIEDGAAVGSKTLVERYRLDYSPATVRNELSYLTDLGYIVQPHTSSGRIPTEKGYRYFVERLVGGFELPLTDRQMIQHQFHQARLELEQWLRLAAAVLAHVSQGASFVTAPRPRFNRFKHVQLISTQGRLVLMVLVLYGGSVKQQMLTLATPLPQPRLSEAADRLNHAFEAMNYDEIQARRVGLEELESDVTQLVLDILRRSDAHVITQIYRDGIGNIVDDEGTRAAVRVLEQRPLLADVVSELITADQNGVHVVIGGEGKWEELKNCTLILSRYGTGEDLAGEVAVVGPTRMAYGRNISAVRFVADLMSGFVNEYYIEDSRPMEENA